MMQTNYKIAVWNYTSFLGSKLQLSSNIQELENYANILVFSMPVMILLIKKKNIFSQSSFFTLNSKLFNLVLCHQCPTAFDHKHTSSQDLHMWMHSGG